MDIKLKQEWLLPNINRLGYIEPRQNIEKILTNMKKALFLPQYILSIK